MKAAVHLLGALLLAAAACVAHAAVTSAAPPTSTATAASTMLGVTDATLARQHYMLQCQGCHRPDGTGTMTTAPPMTGMVARFLAVPGGREYIVRVPGVATAVLTDAQLAELLNWTLYRFDAAHIRADFQPYTAAEVGILRRQPLRTEAKILRASLIAELNQQPPGR